MKSVTLIAIIAMAIQTALLFYYLLTNFGILDFDNDKLKVNNSLQLLSTLGLMFFFIKLCNKQPKN